MTRKKSAVLTEVELKFMKVIWDNGEVTAETMQSELAKVNHPITPGSIRNILAVLSEKGYVKRRKVSVTFFYSAKVGKEEASKSIVEDILTRLFNGSESMMVSTLLNKDNIKVEELDKIFKMVENRKLED